VLLLDDHGGHAVRTVIPERLRRMPSSTAIVAVSVGDIVGGREISHLGFAAKRLMTSSAGRVRVLDRHGAMQGRLDQSLAADIVESSRAS
jgi:hypothetical protein